MRLISVMVATMLGVTAFAHADEPEGARFFREKIEPVLVSECYSCHSAQAKKVQSGLRLDQEALVTRAGHHGGADVSAS